MNENSYPLTKIHLPENRTLTKMLQKVSLAVSLFTLLLTAAILFFSPMAIVFIPALIPLFLEGKLDFLHVANEKNKSLTFFYLSLSIICSLSVMIIGILAVLNFNFPYLKHINLITGLSFLLVSISLILPRIKSKIRFHIAHLLTFTVLVINFMTILSSLYLQFSLSNPTAFYAPLGLAADFVLLCFAILLRWPARGLTGMFTTDSISSMFAFKLLIINNIIAFLLGVLILVGIKLKNYSPYEALAILVMLFTVLSTVFAWVNIRLLYRFELERFVMKEELRIHNIDLKLGNEELVSKMSELQNRNKEITNKLEYRDKYQDAIDSLE